MVAKPEVNDLFWRLQVGRVEQLETAAEAKARRGPKAKIIRKLTRVHTPATATGGSPTLPAKARLRCQLTSFPLPLWHVCAS